MVELIGNPPTIGVDLGRRTIKAVAVRQGKRPTLVHAAIQPTPDGAIDGGAILNVPAVVDALASALRAAHIRAGRAVIGIGGRNVIVRHMTFPPMPADELKSAVRWEAERNLPLRIEEAVLDSQILREITEDGQPRLEVVMAAVPERDALLYHQVATGAGLDVAAIEVSSLALMRVLGDTSVPTAGVVLRSDITEVVIAYKTLPLVCRTLPVGYERLGGRTPAAPVDPDVSGGATEPSGLQDLQDLLEGLARSVDYFQAQAHREKVERVVVTGDGASTPGIVQLIAGELAVPVEVGDPLSCVTAASGISTEILARRASLAVAIGLAMRAVA